MGLQLLIRAAQPLTRSLRAIHCHLLDFMAPIVPIAQAFGLAGSSSVGQRQAGAPRVPQATSVTGGALGAPPAAWTAMMLQAGQVLLCQVLLLQLYRRQKHQLLCVWLRAHVTHGRHHITSHMCSHCMCPVILMSSMPRSTGPAAPAGAAIVTPAADTQRSPASHCRCWQQQLPGPPQARRLPWWLPLPAQQQGQEQGRIPPAPGQASLTPRPAPACLGMC
jgi:hypothetical protein